MSSWLAKATGIHISPKKAYINKKELGRAALAAGGLALGGVGGGLLAKGASKLGGLFKSAPITGAMQDAADDATQFAAGGEPGRFRKIFSGIDMDDLVKYGQAAGDAYGAYTGMKDRNRYQNIAMDEFNANAPLRAKARTMLMDDTPEDLSGIFRAPEPRYRRVRVGSTG